jgi:hypothetical protein
LSSASLRCRARISLAEAEELELRFVTSMGVVSDASVAAVSTSLSGLFVTRMSGISGATRL